MGTKGIKATNIYQNPGIKNTPGIITDPSIKGIGSPAKHVKGAGGKPKGKGHLKKHEDNFWGSEGHGDRSASGIAAGVINKGKKVVDDVKQVVEETKTKIN